MEKKKNKIDLEKHLETLKKYFTAKNYIKLLLVLIIYYSYRQYWDVVIVFCSLLYVFIHMKKRFKRELWEIE